MGHFRAVLGDGPTCRAGERAFVAADQYRARGGASARSRSADDHFRTGHAGGMARTTAESSAVWLAVAVFSAAAGRQEPHHPFAPRAGRGGFSGGLVYQSATAALDTVRSSTLHPRLVFLCTVLVDHGQIDAVAAACGGFAYPAGGGRGYWCGGFVLVGGCTGRSPSRTLYHFRHRSERFGVRLLDAGADRDVSAGTRIPSPIYVRS